MRAGGKACSNRSASTNLIFIYVFISFSAVNWYSCNRLYSSFCGRILSWISAASLVSGQIYLMDVQQI